VLLNLGMTLQSARAGVLKFLEDNPEPRLTTGKAAGLQQRLEIPTGMFTDRLRGSWSVATQIAAAHNAPTILPEHLLAALLSDPNGVAADVLRATKTDGAKLRSTLEASLARHAKKTDAALVLTDPLLRVAIAMAQEEMRDTKHTSLGTGHLLVGFLRQGGECTRILGLAGLELGAARDALRACLRKIDEDPIWDHIG
jgi:ATP-dependent Clp protease ATP-binding subunit ClpA